MFAKLMVPISLTVLLVNGVVLQAQQQPDTEKKMPKTVDEQQAKEMATKLNSMLNQPSDKLLEMARKLGRDVEASLTYGPQLAVLRTRERLLEQSGSRMADLAQQAVEQRQQLRTQLDEELERLRKEFGTQSKAGDQAIIEVIQAYRPVLLSLKEREKHCQHLAEQAQSKRVEVEQERVRVDRARRLAGLGLRPRDLALPPVLPNLPWNDGSGTPSKTQAPQEQESLEDALKSLKDL